MNESNVFVLAVAAVIIAVVAAITFSSYMGDARGCAAACGADRMAHWKPGGYGNVEVCDCVEEKK